MHSVSAVTCASEMNRLGINEYAFLALRLNTPAAYSQAPAATLQSVLLRTPD